MNHLQVKEQKALAIGNSKTKLLKRLKESLSVMNPGGQKIFKGYTYDFAGKRLISPCKKYALQWQLRDDPDQPESYHNQQTSVGTTIPKEI